ncbi:MAG: MBL fold metallo-hydrolase [Clostridia bacterium]|nr:MBL fold metallo-hydrolase [Clostridia bacterium]
MIGYTDVRAVAERLTGLPLILINTHGHIDHIGGNWSFEKAFMSLADQAVAGKALSHPKVREMISHYNLVFPEFENIEDEQEFDLGEITLSAYHFPGHTPGEIVLLDKKDRILFSGDGILEQFWLQLPESISITAQIESMERLLPLRESFDTILSGHSRQKENAELFDTLLDTLKEIRDNPCIHDTSYSWWGGKALVHQYGQGERRIVYNN